MEEKVTAKGESINAEEMSPEALARLIDAMMDKGTSRLKVNGSDELPAGEQIKEYHHGRCDINSPWAKGMAFDVLE